MGAERSRHFPVEFSTRDDVHLAIPHKQHQNGQVGRGGEPEQAHSVAAFHPGYPPASEPDEPGTEQRGYMHPGGRGGERGEVRKP